MIAARRAMPWLRAAIDAQGWLAAPYDRDFELRGR
jgi:hypothetical protein